jgi:hypothetical protein
MIPFSSGYLKISESKNRWVWVFLNQIQRFTGSGYFNNLNGRVGFRV